MNKTAMTALTFILSMTSIPSLLAAGRCVNVSSGNVGQLGISDCQNVWNSLEESGKFPDIFSTTPPKLYPGLCFVSTENIPGTLGNKVVNVTSISAFTNEFAPATFAIGTDNLASVITRWTFKDAQNRVIGSIYTRDTVDTLASTELDVVTDGTGSLFGVKGAIKVNSLPEIDGNGQFSGFIDLISVSGTICLPG